MCLYAFINAAWRRLVHYSTAAAAGRRIRILKSGTLVAKMYPYCRLTFVLVAASVQAQQTLTLESAIETARRTHPLLASGPSRIAAAEGSVTQAALRPNPRLFLQTENWRAWGNPGLATASQTDTYAYVSQPIETAHKRALRTEAARTGLRRAGLERELAERQVVARVKLAWWNAVAAARVHEVLLENVRNFQQIIEYHDIRVREGAVAQADLLRVQLEGERLSLAANTASLDAERARIELFRAMGQTQFPDIRLAGELDTAVEPATADPARALAERTEVKIARQVREEALANASVQRSIARPDVDVLAGYKRTGGFDTLIGGVQVNLPFANRNQGNIAAADASVKIADSEIAAAQAIVLAELRTAERDVAIRKAQVSGTFQKLLAQAGESSRIARAAYREGGADLLRLLDAERVRIELEALYYRTLGEYRQSVAALETAMGIAP